MAAKILIALSTIGGYQPDPLDPLRKAGYEWVLNPYKRKLTADEVKALAHDCVGIVAGLEPLTRDVLDALPQLRCISRSGIGVDNIDMPYAQAKGIRVCITAEAPIQPVVELTQGLLLDLFRQISKADRLIRANAWDRLKGRQVKGKTAAVVGLGRIGRAVASAFQQLGLRVIGVDPMADAAWCAEAGVAVVPLDAALREADVVSLHVSKVPGAGPLIGARELAAMKPTAFLLNMARGGVVDETALYETLKASRIAGAALDVFDAEPYSGPLQTLDNIVLSPHMGTFTQEARVAMEHEAVLNLVQALQSTHARTG